MRIGDAIIGLMCLILSVGYLVSALQLGPSPSLGDVGPAEFPKLIAMVTIMLSLVMIARAAFVKNAYIGKILDRVPAKGLLFLGWSVLFAVLLPVLGSVPSLALYVFGAVVIQAGRRAIGLAIFSAVSVTVLVYGLFYLVLDVPLP